MKDKEVEDPLDTTIIEALIAEIGPESMAKVLDAMAGDADRLLMGLQQALDADKSEAFSLYAHSLKANALTVGAVAVGELFAELERLGAAGTLAGVESETQRAIAEYRELIGFIVTVPDSNPPLAASAG
jgi:HPt (histidine-containing phosphotransfer) domain-containing protein